jgi:hypothetical protein
MYRYIGQAVDIRARVQQHIDSLLAGRAASKLQAAYADFGLPVATVICYCHRDHLDSLEAYYIQEYDDRFCLNTTKPPSTFSYVDEETLEILQSSTESICDLIGTYKTVCADYEGEKLELVECIEELKVQRTEEEIEADVKGKIVELQGTVEDLQSDVEYYKDWIKNVTNLPWYKKIFIKAP